MTYEYTGLGVQITSTEKSYKDRNFYTCQFKLRKNISVKKDWKNTLKNSTLC